MKLKIAILAGDGIGPEVTTEAVNILKAVADFGGHDFAFTSLLVGGVAIDQTGSPLPTATLEACLESDAVLMGAVGDNLPAQIASGVRPQLEAVIGTTRPSLLTFGAIAALWAATGGMNALIKAMNRAWEVEETRALLPRYGTAIGLTLLGSVGVIASFVIKS